jgi:acetyl esterase/lipase
MSYAFDPELAPLVAMLPKVDFGDPVALRAAARAGIDLLPVYEPVTPLTIRDTTIPGPDEAPEVPVRVYTPADRTGPLSGLVLIHGGGFAIGDLELEHPIASRVAAEVGVVVVSVDYRLAPEDPFPAGVEDCYAALLWTAAKAGSLGIDPGRIGVAGESAGGGLAAAVALLARDRGGPHLCFQFLDIPEIDDRLDTPSMRAFADTPLWNRHTAARSWNYYLGEGVPGTANVSPYAAPARARDLTGLPPACVIACEFDPLRDEGLGYAGRLLHAGVSTEIHHYAGTFHGSGLIPGAAVSRRMLADKLGALRRGLRAGTAE